MTVLNFGLNYHENNGNMVLTYIIRFMEEDFMKKRLLMIIAVVTMIFCCGCGNAIPDLSEEESAMVSEYAAGLLLKYDSEYETKFLNEKELEEQEAIQKKIEEEAARRAEIAAAAEQKNQKENDEEASLDGQETETVEKVDPAAFLGLGDISLSCNSVMVCDSYPQSGDDLYFAVSASAQDTKLVVLQFVLQNNGTQPTDVNIVQLAPKFKISINEGAYYNSMITLLNDDLNLYAGTLQPGDQVPLVLIAEMKTEQTEQISCADLYIKASEGILKTRVWEQ